MDLEQAKELVDLFGVEDEVVGAVDWLIAEVERLQKENGSLKEELELTEHTNRCHQESAQPVYEALQKAEAEVERLNRQVAGEATCEGCGGVVEADAIPYEDADICRKCHNEIQAAESVQG